ncbi:anti-sigma factor family protein [Neobacillus sp. NPDC058068]|uniref:anti-sigma factor family protein n=1 Tax=Neobacillus sp. NPDC058068 TaxID=3346325 RepID=UPI0036DC2D53
MKHYSYEEWLQYVKDEMSDQNREQLETHLYTCDQCLELYLQAMAENETSLPILSNQSSFTDLVMAEVSNMVPDTVRNLNTVSMVPLVPDTQHVEQKASKKKSWYQQAGFHYLLAAAATLLLTFSGAFQSLATYAKSIETPIQVQEKKPSVTEGVINKTFAWMDSLEKKEANKK